MEFLSALSEMKQADHTTVFVFTSWILLIVFVTNFVFHRSSLSLTKYLTACSLTLSSHWKRHGKKVFYLGRIWSQMCDKDRLLILFSVYVTTVGSLWAVVQCPVMCHNNCRILDEVLSLTTMSTVLYCVYSHQMSAGWYCTTHSLHHSFQLGCNVVKQTGAWLCVTMGHMFDVCRVVNPNVLL
jgi:hypothetical protein